MGVSINGETPKMDGENNGKTLFFNGWCGGKTHHLRKHPYTSLISTPSHSTACLSVGKEFLLFLGHILMLRNGIAAKHTDPELSMARLIIIPT